MKLLDILGLLSTCVVVGWGLWKIIFKDYPVAKRPPRGVDGDDIRTIVTRTVFEMRESVAEGEKQKLRLEKLLRLAQQSHDANMMHEMLMMYSEYAEGLKSDRERLEYFEELYANVTNGKGILLKDT